MCVGTEESINMIATWRLVPAVLIVSALLAIASPQEVVVKPTWTPPPSRTAKTPFAPKPFSGHNIFKGEAEVWLADAIHKLEGGIVKPIDQKTISDYVTRVGEYLVTYSTAPAKHHEFIVTDTWSADAWTAGGGRIYISRGLLSRVNNEDELAAVLAHEIGHDAFGHAPKTVTRQMFWLTDTKKINTPAEAEAALAKLLSEYRKLPIASVGETLLGFSRFDELEADRAAFYNIYKAGYNPSALATFLKRMARQEADAAGIPDYNVGQFLLLLFASHPPTAQRSMALSWESNFVKMPPKDSRYVSPAFDEMKAEVSRRWHR